GAVTELYEQETEQLDHDHGGCNQVGKLPGVCFQPGQRQVQDGVRVVEHQRSSSSYSASSCGEEVTSRCSCSLASTWKATRAAPESAASRPKPRSAVSRSCRSPSERRKASVTASMAWGACRSRIWVVELLMIACPISEPRRSAASWVTTDSPAQ